VKLYHTPEQKLVHFWLTFGRWGWLCFELIYWRPWRFGIMAWRPSWRSNKFWLPGRPGWKCNYFWLPGR